MGVLSDYKMSCPALLARALRVCSCRYFAGYGCVAFQVLPVQSAINSTSSWSGLRFYRASPSLSLVASSRHLARAGAMGGKGSKGGGGGGQDQESREKQAASGASAEQTAVEAGKEQVTEQAAGIEYVECTVAKVSEFGANE